MEIQKEILKTGKKEKKEYSPIIWYWKKSQKMIIKITEEQLERLVNRQASIVNELTNDDKLIEKKHKNETHTKWFVWGRKK